MRWRYSLGATRLDVRPSRCRYLHSSSPGDCSRRRGENSCGFAEKDRYSSSESREGTYFRSSNTVSTARRTCRNLQDLARVLDRPHLSADTVAQYLKRFIPFSLLVLFTYDSARDELVAEHSFGEVGYLVRDLRIARGDRLSGWVAANRQTIVNSDPTLDLGEIARAISPELRVSLSVPLEARGEVLGVLTLYSSVNEFTPEQQRIAEAACRYFARSLGQPAETISVRS